MVFFTCNHCGDSVKKPSVEKHYNTKCKNGIFVSCMDCQKDFREDYVGHTKCITEAEKYSGKDYVPKEPKNSGQRKQESWTEIVRSILSTKEYDVSPAVRSIFQKLQSYENVPRKKAKFENFVSNSMRVKNAQAAAVWSVLEKAQDKLRAVREAGKKVEGKANGGSAEAGEQVAQNGDTAKSVEDNTDVAMQQEKLSKKRKKAKAQQGVEQNGSVAEVRENHEESPKPKKMKKKNKDAPIENEADSTTANGNGLNEEVAPGVGGNQEEPPKKKKKKSKEVLTENGVDSTTLTDNDPQWRPFAPVIKPNVLDFDWDSVIFKTLGDHNNEMGLEDLKSKVLKKYKKKHKVDEINNKVQKTFNKALKKSGLFVQGDVVKAN